MGVVSILVMLLLIAGVIALIVFTYMRTTNNIMLSTQQQFIPFRMAYDPTTGQWGGNGFNNVSGQPQIQCPAGTSINIVGAFFDVFDPNGETIMGGGGLNITEVLQQQCVGNTPNGQGCSTDSDCNGNADLPTPPDQFKCNTTTKTCYLNPSPTQCIDGSAPQGVGSLKSCSPDVCGTNITGGTGLFPNPTYANASNRCAVRDISALLSAKCNGRLTCGDITQSDLGDYPCAAPNMTPMQCLNNPPVDNYGNANWSNGGYGATRSGSSYCGLPFFPGWNGTAPSQPSSGGSDNADPASANLGYVVHGIYSCVSN